jgi:predicted DNA-binding transcriptional regulator AlpA
MEVSKMLKVSDVQKHLGISQGKVYALIRSKGFPKITIGHRYFIPEDKYIKWIEENVKHTILL